MDIIDTGRELSLLYDSLEDFERTGLKLVREYNMLQADYCVFKKEAGAQWWGMNADSQTVMSRVRDGSPVFLETLKPMLEKLDTEVEVPPHEARVRRRKRTRGDYGDMLHMDRVYQGQIDTAWERPVKEWKLTPSERYASIFIDAGVSWMTTFDETLWRSAAALKLCDMLQKGGRNVEIWCGCSQLEAFIRGPRLYYCGIRCKEYTQPLQPERLATMVSTAFYRTYSFLAMCSTRYTPESSLGMPMQRGLPEQLRKRKEAGELVIRIGNCYNLAGAKQLIDQVKLEIQQTPKDVH